MISSHKIRETSKAFLSTSANWASYSGDS